MRIPWELLLSFALGMLLLYFLGRVLLVPMRFVWRLMAGGLLGGAVLWLVNQFGAAVGVAVAINPFTALTVGFLGLPGAALVVALQYLL